MGKKKNFRKSSPLHLACTVFCTMHSEVLYPVHFQMLIVSIDSVLTMRKIREKLASNSVFNLLSDVIYSFNFATLFPTYGGQTI